MTSLWGIMSKSYLLFCLFIFVSACNKSAGLKVKPQDGIEEAQQKTIIAATVINLFVSAKPLNASNALKL